MKVIKADRITIDTNENIAPIPLNQGYIEEPDVQDDEDTDDFEESELYVWIKTFVACPARVRAHVSFGSALHDYNMTLSWHHPEQALRLFAVLLSLALLVSLRRRKKMKKCHLYRGVILSNA